MKTLIIGAGCVGATIAQMLGSTGDYEVTVADRDEHRLERLDGARSIKLDADDSGAVETVTRGQNILVNALPFSGVEPVARVARAAGAHYFYVTEDVAATRLVRALAQDAPMAFLPQCGLAPGFAGIAAHDLAQKFERVTHLHMRVGALPRFPTNGLKYNLTWSTESRINEYCNPCEVILSRSPGRVAPADQ